MGKGGSRKEKGKGKYRHLLLYPSNEVCTVPRVSKEGKEKKRGERLFVYNPGNQGDGGGGGPEGRERGGGSPFPRLAGRRGGKKRNVVTFSSVLGGVKKKRKRGGRKGSVTALIPLGISTRGKGRKEKDSEMFRIVPTPR